MLRDKVRDPKVWFLDATSALFGIVGDYTEEMIMAVPMVPLLGMDAFMIEARKLRRKAQHFASGTIRISQRGGASAYLDTTT